MNTKPFSQELHDKHDPRARKVLIDLLMKTEFFVSENPNKYGIDILVGCPVYMYIDVEVKEGWKGYDFPFPNLNIPVRKGEHIDPERWLCVMNNPLTRCAIVHSETLRIVPQEEVPNKYVPEGEYFFKVPLEYVKFIDLKERE